jgi:hypothetical protein
VDQMLRRRAQQHPYTPSQTVNWLSWLAHQMGIHGQTAFYLERLQLDWLPRRQSLTIRVCTGLVFRLLSGPVLEQYAQFVWPNYLQGLGQNVGLVVGLLFGDILISKL